ncbi:MAG: biopolymer transporter ExbD, partial [Planctomycetaceae bacterium]|nr:biopolymer transporter ExbD [Planctomycetaceae bacterium]
MPPTVQVPAVQTASTAKSTTSTKKVIPPAPASGKPGSSASRTATKSAPQPKKKSLVTVSLPSWEEEEEEDFHVNHREPELEEMDLTPMVDVTFLLLIFFMITASFNLQKHVEMPPAASDETSTQTVVPPEDSPSVEAVIDPDNRITINDLPGETFDELVSLLNQERGGADSAELKLLIDPESTHEKRILVADAAAKAGFVKI